MSQPARSVDAPSASRAALAVVGLLGVSLLVLVLVRLLEGGSADLLWAPRSYLLTVDHDIAADRLAGAAEVVAGVLAILITVVAIVVELAANRYTHRITQLFVREPLNAAIVGLFVVTTILCLWLSTLPAPASPDLAPLPSGGLVVCMALITLCLLSLLPYLSFLFRFISPLRVIDRIRQQAEAALVPPRSHDIDRARAEIIEATEELEDIARGGRDGTDRGIAMAAVDALSEFVEHYAQVKRDLPDAWFSISQSLAHDPDFVAMDESALRTIESNRSWLEAKVMRQYHAIYTESLGRARDVASLIAIHTRRLGAVGALPLPLTLQFFNSFMRAAINERDLRTAYYVLNHYRMLGETRMEAGAGDDVLAIGGHLRFYGRLGHETGQPFLLEVVAYDLGLLIERAASEGRDELDGLLALLLEIEERDGGAGPAAPTVGVRRAQIRIATFFLERGDEARARRIADTVASDAPERLRAIRDELMHETHSQYREFTDRGVNFSYLEPGRRAQLDRFFDALP